MRDSQQSKLYAAEEKALYILQEKQLNKKIEKIKDITQFVNTICNRAWFKKRWGNHNIFIKDGRGTRWAHGGGDTVNLPVWARHQLFILHELAHNLSSIKHNWKFAKDYLELVYFVLGQEAHKILRDCFKEYRVKYYPKRVLSLETKEKLKKNFIQNVLRISVET